MASSASSSPHPRTFYPFDRHERVAAIFTGPTAKCPYRLLVEDAVEELDAYARTLEGAARLHFLSRCIDWCVSRSASHPCLSEQMTTWMEDETELESELSRAAPHAEEMRQSA